MSNFIVTNRHASILTSFEQLKKELRATGSTPAPTTKEEVKCPRCGGPGQKFFGRRTDRWGIACLGEPKCRTTWERKPGDPEPAPQPKKASFADLKKSNPTT